MIVQIRRCCCTLATLVNITCVSFVVLYFCGALASVVWFLLFSNPESAANNNVLISDEEDGEIDGFEDFDGTGNTSQSGGNNTFKTLAIFVISLVFAFVGTFVNLLVICSIRIGKRTLILPWLVFHIFQIMGKYRLLLGIWSYISLKPTILQYFIYCISSFIRVVVEYINLFS